MIPHVALAHVDTQRLRYRSLADYEADVRENSTGRALRAWKQDAKGMTVVNDEWLLAGLELVTVWTDTAFQVTVS